jgi:hypothetical protein
LLAQRQFNRVLAIVKPPTAVPRNGVESKDVDEGLLEAIENMTEADFKTLRAKAEASGTAGALSAMEACIARFVNEAEPNADRNT